MVKQNIQICCVDNKVTDPEVLNNTENYSVIEKSISNASLTIARLTNKNEYK